MSTATEGDQGTRVDDRLINGRTWTRFLAKGWRDPSVPCPEGTLPHAEVMRLGLGPLAYRVLRNRAVERSPLLEAGYRSAARRNLATIASVAPARDLLSSRGISQVLVKGGAFLFRHAQSDLGVRAMADFDLLVGPERFDDAFAALTAAGWRRTNPELKHSGRVAPAITLFKQDALGPLVQIDLHRHLAQWPLLKELPARVLDQAEEVAGWRLPSQRHALLIVALHRARHAFANDARDLLDCALSVNGLDEECWRQLVDEAEVLGISGALYGTVVQAAWWFADEGDILARRATALRARFGGIRRALLDRMADPSFTLRKISPWSGPLGRNFGVFPAALGSPLRSLAAAVVFLPRRVREQHL